MKVFNQRLRDAFLSPQMEFYFRKQFRGLLKKSPSALRKPSNFWR
jgi:hypothetical protein